MKTITVTLVLALIVLLAVGVAGCGLADPLRIVSTSRSSSEGSGPTVSGQPAAPEVTAPTVAPGGAPPAKPAPEGSIPPAPAPEDKAGPAPTVSTGLATPTPDEGLYAGWPAYTNQQYGFALRYPDSWTLTEEPSDGRLSPVVKLDRDACTLVIGYKAADEDLIIEAGMPAGDLAYRGKVTMLGVTVTREVLAYEGKDKAVYYNGTSPVEAGDLRMLVSLQDLTTSDYAAVSLSEDVQSEADLIVESIEMQ